MKSSKNWFVVGFVLLVMNVGNVFAQPAGSPVARHGWLRVEGNRLVDEHGIPTQLRGVSTYWGQNPNAATVKWLADDWKISIIRVSLTDRQLNVASVRDIMNAAIANGIYIALDYHTHSANLNTALTSFRAFAREYKNIPNIIYEIYNEPCPSTETECSGDDWQNDIRPYSEAVIKAIRDEDPNNIIVVGTPSWSQGVNTATQPQNLLFPDEPELRKNLVYAFHFYASAQSHEWMRASGQTVLDRGHTIFSSEFGIGHWNVFGPVDPVNAQIWFDFLDENMISWASWSLSRSREDNALIRSSSTASATAVPANGWRTGGDICNVPYRRAEQAYDSVRIWRNNNQLIPVDRNRIVNSRYVSCTAHGDLSCTGHFIRHKLRRAYAIEMGHRVNFDLNGGTGTEPATMHIVPGTSIGEHRPYKPHDGIGADGTGTGGINANTMIPHDEWIVLPSTDLYTKTGYRNDGNWYTNAAGTTLFVPGTTPVNANTTLYLKWDIDPDFIEYRFLFDDLENGDKVNNFGYDWQFSAYSGGVITNAQPGDDFNAMTFAPTSVVNRDGSSGYSAVLEYRVPSTNSGVSMTSSLTGDENIPVGEMLKDLTAISFWAKGTPGNSVWFMLQTTQYATTPINYNRYHVKFTPVSEEWTQYTFNIGPIIPVAVEGASIGSTLTGEAGDFKQSTGWGQAFTFSPENLTKLVWEIDGSTSQASRTGNLYIDDIQFITIGKPINVTLPFTATYKTNEGGALKLGSVVTRNDIHAKRQPGAFFPPVEAIADDDYIFIDWSDGVTDNPRTDAASNMTVTARFMSIDNPFTYTVTFADWDGTVIKTVENVAHGAPVTDLPENPVREGYDFVNWDVEFDNVTDNLTVTALYTRNISTTQIVITGGNTFFHTGSAITPAISVTFVDGDAALVLDKDYTVSYNNNTNMGSAEITVTGIGAYSGTAGVTFTIIAHPVSKVVATINGNPKSQMGFNWETVASAPAGMVQIVEGRCEGNQTACFENAVSFTARIVNNSTANTTYRKAEANGLTAGTSYSYRVGSSSGWSETGTFTTAPAGKESFSFLYTSDPQGSDLEDFQISGRTVNAALNQLQSDDKSANLWLMTGDHIDNNQLTTLAATNQWTWFFQELQSAFYQIPYAPVIGNHDDSNPYLFNNLFNTGSPVSPLSQAPASAGSLYSFVYGDLIFFALNFETHTDAYLNGLRAWMEAEIKRHEEEHSREFRWRIAYSHRGVFTGGDVHHSRPGQIRTEMVRINNAMAPIYRDLGIDIGIHGHNHVYEVIGPVTRDRQLVDAQYITGRVPVPASQSQTEYMGGVFDVTEGTLYFCNGSMGGKRYNPVDQNLNQYPTLFTGGFANHSAPCRDKCSQSTYSIIDVTDGSITFKTYTVDDDGKSTLYDSFSVTKPHREEQVIAFEGNDGAVTVSHEVAGTSFDWSEYMPNITGGATKNLVYESKTPDIAAIDAVTGVVTVFKTGTAIFEIRMLGNESYKLSNVLTMTMTIEMDPDVVIGTAAVSGFGDSYYYHGRTNAAFLQESFDMSAMTSWTLAPTAIGFGSAGGTRLDGTADNSITLATTLANSTGAANAGTASARHTWTYFKKTFELPANFDVESIQDVLGQHRIDDALIIYINGIEVYRYNVGTTNNANNVTIGATVNWGAYTGYNTDATTRPFHINSDYTNRDMGFQSTTTGTQNRPNLRDAASRTNLNSALKSGTNIITCVVGQNSANSSDLWFDLELKIEYEFTPAKPCNHDMSGWEITLAPTCILPGSQVMSCLRPNCNHNVEEAIDALDHDLSDWEITLAPTCVLPGSLAMSCMRLNCTHKVEDVIAALNHDYNIVTIAASCEKDGSITTTCKNLNCPLHRIETIEAIGHDYNIVTVAASCEEAGSITTTCKNLNCPLHRIETIEAIRHDYNIVTVAASCEEAGSITTTCKNPNCQLHNVKTIEAIGHDYNIVTVAASCEKDGSITTTCKNLNCPLHNVKTIEAIGHDYNIVTVAASCEEAGSITTTCNNPNCLLHSVQKIEAIGHIMGEWNITLAPTCLLPGSQTKSCLRKDCDHNVADVIEKLDDCEIPPPVITITTQSETEISVTEGSINTMLTVIASVTGGSHVSYQWYSNTVNSASGGTVIKDETKAIFTLPDDLAVGTYYYYCEISALGAENTITNVIEVTVAAAGGKTNIRDNDRFIPKTPETEITAISSSTLAAGLAAGPNPAVKSTGRVDFFRQGLRINDAALTVYDAMGNVIRKIVIRDAVTSLNDSRIVGTWDLKDAAGRAVPEGTYLVRGVIKTSDGKSERVSLMIGVK